MHLVAAPRNWKNKNHHRNRQTTEGEFGYCFLLCPPSKAVPKKHFAVVHPIMVCTYTNVAVDNLVEGFVTAGLDPVRIGYGKTKSALQEHSFEFKMEQHPLYPAYEVVSENLEKLEKDLSRTCARIFEQQKRRDPACELSRLKSYRDVLSVKMSRFSSRKQAMYQQMQTEVLTSADVVRFPASYTSSELMNTLRYALPASAPVLSC